MTDTATQITTSTTVNDVVRQHPATIPVFNEFGIDSCCGGAVDLCVAAERDGADLATLMARLNTVIQQS